MQRMKKVITQARFEAAQSTRALNLNTSARSILIGRRSDYEQRAQGFIGKVIETSSTASILDYGIWIDLSFPHVIGIFGTRGKGKSFTLGVFDRVFNTRVGVNKWCPPYDRDCNTRCAKPVLDFSAFTQKRFAGRHKTFIRTCPVGT